MCVGGAWEWVGEWTQIYPGKFPLPTSLLQGKRDLSRSRLKGSSQG